MNEDYMKHIESMSVPAELKLFDQQMKQTYGDTVPVWRNRVPPLAALMVVRHGEDASKWPSEFSAQDIQRARSWLSGKKIPAAVAWAIKH